MIVEGLTTKRPEVYGIQILSIFFQESLGLKLLWFWVEVLAVVGSQGREDDLHAFLHQKSWGNLHNWNNILSHMKSYTSLSTILND